LSAVGDDWLISQVLLIETDDNVVELGS